MRRLMREITELKNNPPEGIRVVTSEENMLELTGIVEGPGEFLYTLDTHLKLKFLCHRANTIRGWVLQSPVPVYTRVPCCPSKMYASYTSCFLILMESVAIGWFTTKIFHPNVSSAGEICVNTLKKDWQASYGIGYILVTIKCLLIYPNPESALDEEAGKLLLEDYDAYCSRAKLITSVHATPRIRPPEFDAPATETVGEASTKSILDLISTPTIAPPSQHITLPVPAPASSPRKSLSPAPPAQPLQSSPANTLPSMNTISSKDCKGRLSPLGTANPNVAVPVVTTTSKAVKRPAASGGLGIEKRKKALKRL